MFFDEIKAKKSGMTEFEYNQKMADKCCELAIGAYHADDLPMIIFWKSSEKEFRRRAMDGRAWTKDQTMKCLQNCKSGILLKGTKSRSGVCIR